MRRVPVLTLLLLSAISWADASREQRRHLTAAANQIDQAQSAVSRASRMCRETVADRIDDIGDKLEGLRNNPKGRELRRLLMAVAEVSAAAPLAACPPAVVENLQQAADHLEEVRESNRDRRDDDDDDDRGGRGRPRGFATLQPLKVTIGSVFENEPSVRIQLPELTLSGMRGQTFYLGARFRSYEGEWSEWVTTQRYSVPNDPFSWKNPFNHFIRYSRLAEDDFSDGRYLVRVSLFDANGEEMAFREATFRATVPSLPGPPPPRECGTGPNDVGCGMVRDGSLPMDGTTYLGLMQSLRATSNELTRDRIVANVLANQYVTANQLGGLMDQFNNELLKLEVVKRAVPRLVNPQHALGLAAKFRNGVLASECTRVLSGQPPGPQQPPPPPPPNPGYPPPPPPGRPPPPNQPPPPPMRDCGIQGDPGCGMSRDRRFPMDGTTFQGMMQGMRASSNQFTRRDSFTSVLANNYLTAAQLGQVLDLFDNEITRLDVAQKAAPKVVNPQHALGFAAKWNNSLLGRDFTQAMASQRPVP